MENIILDDLLTKISTKPLVIKILGQLTVIFIIIAAAILAYYLFNWLNKRYIRYYILKSNSDFLQILAKKNDFKVFGHLFAAIIFKLCSNLVILHNELYEQYISIIINKLAMLYIFIFIIIAIIRIIKSINSYYELRFIAAKKYPITSYINLIIFLVWLLWGIFILAFFTNVSMASVVTCIGATSAALLLIFRDTLLGIVASIQAAASNIVRVGDRICIDKYNLDGIVVSISIAVVKIQNSDNTMVTIPTYYLTSEAVKNWRTMHESGVRRIKRSILINANSIKELSSEEINDLVENKYILEQNICQNNLALYRSFIENYLKNNSYISKRDVILVRYLDHEASGLPLEVYAYINKANFVDYENIQSEIIEYCLLYAKKFSIDIVQLL
jgi:miniconductance mechanosensitive channel